VFQIRIGLDADPDPVFDVNTGPDLAKEVNPTTKSSLLLSIKHYEAGIK